MGDMAATNVAAVTCAVFGRSSRNILWLSMRMPISKTRWMVTRAQKVPALEPMMAISALICST